MGSRRSAREMAIQILYGLDINPGPVGPAFEEHLHWRKMADEEKEFVRDLVEGTRERLNELDSLITDAALKWELSRMAVVDRNVLRLAAYEMTEHENTPVKVIINEAIELAKSFGGEDSSIFVNGVLDRIRVNVGRDINETAS
ncbi:MAG: transcription antitermination factor NusB [bacterium]